MLAAMRKKKILNLFLWLVIIAFLATIVVVWGLGDNQADTTYIAKIDNNPVSYIEYSNTYDRTANQMRQLYGGQIEDFLSSEAFGITVLNNIISDKLLLDEANRIALPVSNTEIVNEIVNDASFADDNGSFDQIVYQETLQYYGLTPPAYEAQIRQEITLKKMRQLIMSAVLVTDEEINNEYTYQNTNMTTSYFRVDVNNYVSNEEPDPAALENYFKANIENYRKAPQVKIKSISFDPADFDYEFTATEEDIRARYNATLADYTTPESLELNQIVVGVEDWNNGDEVKQAETKINAAAEELKAGEDFASVARKYSDSTGPNDDGSVGTVTRPETETDLYTFIFALNDNEISEIYTSDFGYHIFITENHQPETVTPFEHVKTAIENTMREESFAGAYRSSLYSMYRNIMNAGNITAYTQQNPDVFTVEETSLLAEDDPSAFFQNDQNIKNAIFAIGLTEITPLLDFNGKTYIYELTEKVNSYLPELADVKDQVATDYRRELARTAALAAVSNVINADGMSTQEFTEAAKKLNLSTETHPPFSRTNPVVDVEWAQGLGDTLYTNNEGAVITYPGPMGAYIYVIHIDAAQKPIPEAIDAYTKSMLQNDLLYTKQTDAVAGYVENLKTQHKIEINPTFTGRR